MKTLFNIIFFSIIGYIYETILKFIFSYKHNSGLLFGPYTLIYGITSVILFHLYDKFNNKKNKNLYFLLISFLIISSIELFTGYLLETFFNQVYWNYSNYPLNIGKYTSFFTTFFFSVASILVYKYILPKTNKLFIKTNKKIIIIFSTIIILDIIISCIIKLDPLPFAFFKN